MRTILLLGAGRSASSLIQYLARHAAQQQWTLTVAERDLAQANKLVHGAGDAVQVVELDANQAEARAALIGKHDLVISMLPAFMHMDVLRDCLRLKKHVITPSYVPDALWPLDAEFKRAGLTVLNEMGADPGIDHMSAMRILDHLRSLGARMEAFESYCGGLVAPESDDNPWGYKFSWNPRNVVLAGQGPAARYIQEGELKYIPYHRLFRRTTRVELPGLGAFDGYANRDSLKYRGIYGIADIPTMLRGTLRKEGYCEAWDALVQLGCTEDGFNLELPAEATWADFLNAFLPARAGAGLRTAVADHLGLDPTGAAMEKLEWLGLFGTGAIGQAGLSPAATLQRLLEAKWVLGPADKDLLVMWHRFRYALNGRSKEVHAALSVIGQDSIHTAMAQCVGLPIGIGAKLLLNGQVRQHGVLLPLAPELYNPILDELATLGIAFQERAVEG
ncbi:MAG: saccharopine dehydrogenase NADP-binding domain-containing protein [Flavobacteriales bacterium]|nr:saccharopine dehydrogenase NADP-binding domain-containing protein [Flavobacteriales bacterium]MBP9080215.1 saccharopine dehydrogenase NADP-binding domain-containing protein [Flavobacteriales bacterium]